MIRLRHRVAAALLLTCSFLGTVAYAEDVLRYGIEASYPPFESKSANGELQGFDIDLGKAVCAAAKMSCSWIETSFDGLIPALQGRKFDAINSAMNVTEKREQTIDFTTVIYRVPSQLIARVGSGLQPTAASLKGKSVGVLQGSIHENFARAHWATAGVNVVTYQDQNQVFNDLTSGRLDATLVLSPSGQSAFLSTPEGKGFTFAGVPVQDEKILGRGVAFGLRQGDGALKEKLNAAIKQVKAEGTIEKLSKKYFGDIDVTAK
ncbi:ABC transporter substrate-binding protein [Paraburkholderia sp. RP-4-7]|uniref:ABC transporter substrate-binding protein n=1 Tax=Paraburkholderia polaris TaxID=2728848 RepID=A0A848IQB4_9BURK|nr:ABC transporter substrate-binding protein [Paraburkholderia polaris]NMM04538.1 ABC transporter substrate-binding protein [Paraburkholderia polaris]